MSTGKWFVWERNVRAHRAFARVLAGGFLVATAIILPACTAASDTAEVATGDVPSGDGGVATTSSAPGTPEAAVDAYLAAVQAWDLEEAWKYHATRLWPEGADITLAEYSRGFYDFQQEFQAAHGEDRFYLSDWEVIRSAQRDDGAQLFSGHTIDESWDVGTSVDIYAYWEDSPAYMTANAAFIVWKEGDAWKVQNIDGYNWFWEPSYKPSHEY